MPLEKIFLCLFVLILATYVEQQSFSFVVSGIVVNKR